MISRHALGAGALGLLFFTAAIEGQIPGHYRDFQLGSDLASVSALTGAASPDVKVLHTRPAVLQEMEWRRPYALRGETVDDPVRQIAFSFYNDQLFRLVIDYDERRTDGMTDADMVEAISTMYGTTVRSTLKPTGVPPLVRDEESGTRVAGWGNGDYAAVLYRTPFASGFRLVVAAVRLDALARTAEAQSIRLDEREAPQRERARQKKEADDERAEKAKARLANKAAFKP